MKYYLSVPEDGRGQEIFRPSKYRIEAGEKQEVDKTTYDEHHDRDVFEASTENEAKSAKQEESASEGEE